MGAYLNTNLNVSVQYIKEEADKLLAKHNIGLDKLLTSVIGDTEHFIFTEQDGMYRWDIKPEIFKDNLYNFLNNYYAELYGGSEFYEKYCKETLISILKSEDICDESKKIDSYCFDYSERWEYNFDHSSMIRYFVHNYRLSTEGKVVTEGIYRHLEYFTKLIRERYADNPLANCINIEVS